MINKSLIASLSADLKPVRRNVVERQIAAAALIGGGLSFVALMSTFGIQPDLMATAHLVPFAIKTGFALSLATVAFASILKLARPDGLPTDMVRKASFIALSLASLALVQAGYANNAGDARLVLGASWQSCSLRIAAFSIPIAIALGWVVRRQAPIRLARAGAAVGLAAGGLSAALYALACNENSSTFVLVWYSAGIALSTATGALLGPRLLRW